jgi:hypothetical protein
VPYGGLHRPDGLFAVRAGHTGDDSKQRFRTLYCAIRPETALREVLADLRRHTDELARYLETFGEEARTDLPEASVAEEAAAALDATDKDVSIGGAGLAAAAIELGLVDELRMFPQSGRRRWRYAVPAAGRRTHSAGSGRDQDVRLARDLRALRARPQ